MLSVKEVSTFYGKIQVLWSVSLEVREREIVALVGANGAGKTTLLNTISGIVRLASGSVQFRGRRLDKETAASIVELGITQVPQGGRLFSEMTVKENLEMGAYQTNAWKKNRWWL
jgi:branched-chain amino acid transport system ATP-binding protein